MDKTTVLLPEDLNRTNAVIVNQSDLERVAGMIEAATWFTEDPLNDMLVCVLHSIDRMLGKEE